MKPTFRYSAAATWPLIQTDASVGVECGVDAVERADVLPLVLGAQHLADGHRIGVEIAAAVKATGHLGTAGTVVDRGRRPRAERPIARRIYRPP